MINRRKILFSAAAAFVSSEQHLSAQDECGHNAWVRSVYQRMMRIQPGMSRAELLISFSAEGGFRPPHIESFVSRDCNYFNVDVTFRAARQGRGHQAVAQIKPDLKDVIVTISRPYIAPAAMD